MSVLTIEKSGYENPSPGAYPATFQGLETIETQKGKCYRWVWALDSGKTVSGLSDLKVTDQNKTGRWLAGLAGKPVVAGLSVDPAAYVGKRYTLIWGDKALTTLTPIA